MSSPLILLDRDGVLNRMVIVDGGEDSPMIPSEVEVFPEVPAALARLTRAGCGLAVVTNQPAAAKGKTTRENLEAVHARVIAEASAAGARILSSHLCYHRAEDGCACRKPAVGLLEAAFAQNPGYDRARSWMVGDRATDILAGQALGLRTALIGEASGGDCVPTCRAPSVAAFVDFWLQEDRP